MSETVNKPHHHAHHFQSAGHEFEASKFGVWIFLCTEILMFGGLFVAYIMFSTLYPEVFEVGSTFLDWKLGAINTAVLLFSSFTIAVSIRNLQMKEKNKAIRNLIITLMCGFVFMGIKAYEYNHKFHQGLYPGKYFNYQPHGEGHGNSHAGDHGKKEAKSEGSGKVSNDSAAKKAKDSGLPENLPMYFSLYFIMTGIHGSHVLIGMGLITWCLIRARKDEFGPEYYTPVEGTALFWHLVDLVWIYLFPLLYLI